MKVQTLLELVIGFNEFAGEVYSINTSTAGTPLVTLSTKAFLETFQTYDETEITSGRYMSATFCNVKFCAIAHKEAD